MTTTSRKEEVDGHKLGIVPIGGCFLTCAVDVQIDHFVFMVVAWNQNPEGCVVDYGTLDSWSDVKKHLTTKYDMQTKDRRLASR